jgi:RNA recognition motif-containing protein
MKTSFAFLEYKDYQSAIKAVKKLNGKNLFAKGKCKVEQSLYNSSSKKIIEEKKMAIAKDESVINSGNRKRCYRCRAPGHYARYCPYRKI